MDELLERGIHLFNSRRFFECHEVWEEVWTPERGPRRLFLQSLIHFAVGLYHTERGNPVGAARQLRKGLRKLAAYLPHCEGIDTARLMAMARSCWTHRGRRGLRVSANPRPAANPNPGPAS